MSVEFTAPAGSQYIDFGSAISGVIGLTTFSVSLWVYADDVGAGSNCTYYLIWDGVGTDTDQYIAIYRGTVNEQKLAFQAHWSTQDGIWVTTSNQFTAVGWYHVVITYDGSSTANNPSIYINGSSKNVTESQAPTGTFRTGTSANLYVGDTLAGWAPDGKVADVRTYNIALTSAQASALHAASPFTPNFDTNLVFNPPLNNCTALSGSAFDGFTLTSSQIFYDRISCVQGTPSGSPLGSDTNPS